MSWKRWQFWSFPEQWVPAGQTSHSTWLLPSDEFLPPSLPKNSDISHVLEKVLICIFLAAMLDVLVPFLGQPRAEFSKLNESIIFLVFSLQEEYSTYHHLLPCCAVLEEQGDKDGQTYTWAVHLYKHRWYSNVYYIILYYIILYYIILYYIILYYIILYYIILVPSIYNTLKTRCFITTVLYVATCFGR